MKVAASTLTCMTEAGPRRLLHRRPRVLIVTSVVASLLLVERHQQQGPFEFIVHFALAGLTAVATTD